MASASTSPVPDTSDKVVKHDAYVLSIDSGGPRGLSSLFVLDELLQQVNEKRRRAGLFAVKPCELFDLIGGTGSGGLIALLLGRFEMTVTECIEAYTDMCERMFVKERRSFWFGGRVSGRFDASEVEAWVSERTISHQGTKRLRSARSDSGTGPRPCRVLVSPRRVYMC